MKMEILLEPTSNKLLVESFKDGDGNGVSIVSEVLGLTTAHAIWTALETAYSNSSVEMIHSLCDSLRNLSKGTSTVSDYGRQFKEDGPPISDAPVPESRPTDTRPSSSSPCGLCPVPTTAAEPIHEPDSTPSSPYSSEDDNPPTDSSDVSSHGAPPAPPATAPTEPSSVHQMKTRSKSGIFKTKHSPDFVSLTSHALHAALFSLVQPKGFKSAAKHPQWMAAIA
ncbi:hypothetical protein Tco_0261629 [Tanacetum coccineum]